MGWWRTSEDGESLQVEETGLIWGDRPADVFDNAIDCVEVIFTEERKRKPTKKELIAGLLFSLHSYKEDDLDD